jgi:hypothetical protein
MEVNQNLNAHTREEIDASRKLEQLRVTYLEPNSQLMQKPIGGSTQNPTQPINTLNKGGIVCFEQQSRNLRKLLA